MLVVHDWYCMFLFYFFLCLCSKRYFFNICLVFLYPPHNEVVGGYTGFNLSVRPSVRLSVWPYHSYIWTFFSEKTVFMNSSQLLNLGSEVVWLITPDMLCRLQKNEKIGQVQKSGLQILRTLSVRNFFFPIPSKITRRF